MSLQPLKIIQLEKMPSKKRFSLYLGQYLHICNPVLNAKLQFLMPLLSLWHGETDFSTLLEVKCNTKDKIVCSCNSNATCKSVFCQNVALIILEYCFNPYIPRMFFSVDYLTGPRRTLSLHVQYS